MAKIILSTLNARYIHSSLGLRYLKANMANLESETSIREFIINTRPIDIVEQLLEAKPRIIGFGIYIWNVEQTTEVIKLLKTIAPEIIIILGGPEVSYEYQQQEVMQYCDYLITGQADLEFVSLCSSILSSKPAEDKIIHAQQPSLDKIKLPYYLYSDNDIANRILYVEASRGCPFKCEFCLSSLDKTAWPFNIDLFLDNMQTLYERGARHFKFVDRTFNLKIENSIRIMQFFLDRMKENELFLHFELIPDHLPDKLKALISQFPPHSLQFEIGIQSLNPHVQTLISRKQNDKKVSANLAWLRDNSQAHIHADLIIGLPGESMEMFANGFNTLVALNPHEIQVGILKRLKGTPLIRHTFEHELCFNPSPPFNILQTGLIDFKTMQRLSRFARYWDMIANSGRFIQTKSLILGQSPFENFMIISDWLFTETGQTHKIALERLFKLLYIGALEILGLDKATVQKHLLQDYERSGIKGKARFLESAPVAPITKISQQGHRQKQHSY